MDFTLYIAANGHHTCQDEDQDAKKDGKSLKGARYGESDRFDMSSNIAEAFTAFPVLLWHLDFRLDRYDSRFAVVSSREVLFFLLTRCLTT